LFDPLRGETLASDPENAVAPRLALEGISTFYGEAQVLREISLTVRAGQIVALLGSNGAGKTTLLKTLTGLLVPRSGSILFEGRRLEGLAAHRVIAQGIASVPEGRELFGSLSVMDNLLIGTYSLSGEKRKEALADRLKMVFTLFPILQERLKQKAETMSGGQQQMLAIGRALMAMPKLLALDEPSLGLSPLLVTEVMRVLKEIARQGELSLLLVEQNARAALKIADYVYVLERGELVLSGTAREVVDSPVIQSAYLGG
jgi:branched-chain amino acid transport system ATP-binding protein